MRVKFCYLPNIFLLTIFAKECYTKNAFCKRHSLRLTEQSWSTTEEQGVYFQPTVWAHLNC